MLIFPLPCRQPTTEAAREWRDEDDRQAAEATIFTMDYYSFGEKGPMLHGIDDVGCYLIESTVGPMDFISHFRRLYLHLYRKSLLEPNAPKCYQTFCQGLWSSMDLQRNEHARLITLRFCDGTRHPLKTLVPPQMILNFMAIDRDKQEFPNEIWYIIQSLSLASIGVSADDTGSYIFWIRSRKQMLGGIVIDLNLGDSTSTPSNIREIIEAMRDCQYIDLISREQLKTLRAFQLSTKTHKMDSLNGFQPLPSETVSVSIANSYIREVDRSKVDPSKLASKEEISGIRVHTSLIHTLHLAQSMLTEAHRRHTEQGFEGLRLMTKDRLADASASTMYTVTIGNQLANPRDQLGSSSKSSSGMYIALPDGKVHPYCLRDVNRFVEDDRPVMLNALLGHLADGRGILAQDHHEYVYTVTQNTHEFF